MSDDLPLFPTHYADCCVAISKKLVDTVCQELSQVGGLSLSVGCGSGRFEALLLQHHEHELDIVGIEVTTCVNKHLPSHRFVQVQEVTTIYEDAILASTLLFIYPRSAILVQHYLQICKQGALEKVLLLTTRSEWSELSPVLEEQGAHAQEVLDCGLPQYDILVAASIS